MTKVTSILSLSVYCILLARLLIIELMIENPARMDDGIQKMIENYGNRKSDRFLMMTKKQAIFF